MNEIFEVSEGWVLSEGWVGHSTVDDCARSMGTPTLTHGT